MSTPLPKPVVPPASVQFTPPPPNLRPDIRRSIDAELAKLKAGERGALVLVGTKHGDKVKFNATVVARVGDHWSYEIWMAKAWGEKVEGGVSILKTW